MLHAKESSFLGQNEIVSALSALNIHNWYVPDICFIDFKITFELLLTNITNAFGVLFYEIVKKKLNLITSNEAFRIIYFNHLIIYYNH